MNNSVNHLINKQIKSIFRPDQTAGESTCLDTASLGPTPGILYGSPEHQGTFKHKARS